MGGDRYPAGAYRQNGMPEQARAKMVGIRPEKIADAIAAHIETLILQGVLRPGEMLTAERDLAFKLDVSRPSLRQALDKLTGRGLLTPTRGGTVVAEFLAPMMEPLANLYRGNQNAFADYFEFRKCVEGQAARSAALRATNIEKVAIRACIKEMRRAHKIEDPTQEAQADVNLHMLVYEAGHNFVILHLMRALSELLRNNIFFNRTNLYQRHGVREMLLGQHVEIADAVLSGDPDRAEAAAADHIRFVVGAVEELQRDNKRLKTSLLRITRADLISGT